MQTEMAVHCSARRNLKPGKGKERKEEERAESKRERRSKKTFPVFFTNK